MMCWKKEKQTTDAKKAWLIEFNTPLVSSSVHEENVYIIDSGGNKLSFIQPVIEKEKYIRLKNNEPFSFNTLYYIVIEKEVTSVQASKLKKGLYVPFTVQ